MALTIVRILEENDLIMIPSPGYFTKYLITIFINFNNEFFPLKRGILERYSYKIII